ncbi:MAG: hypothetical protein EZS28_049007 [Streblomastix strix]|uniref:Uncharacterized protein n=1 Tax=Streblomastix strix TaxID=222440 RepID=A0A5J4TB52_9EUKA|nr:MAG: hypothetical protein EZS28_049007 [Streblomastix strix]
MKLIIEEERRKPKVILPGQYKQYQNQDGPAFFYLSKNYHPTPISRPKDLNLSEEQWEQFDKDVREVPEAIIGLIVFATEQIIEQSKAQSKDNEGLMNELE